MQDSEVGTGVCQRRLEIPDSLILELLVAVHIRKHSLVAYGEMTSNWITWLNIKGKG